LVKHDEKLDTCQYKYERDYPTEVRFRCKEPPIANSKLCIFHHKEHSVIYEQEATKRFEEKVRESISQDNGLECFGYYLPVIINFARLLEGKSFAQPVYFNDATFSKEADFSWVTFSKEVTFVDATFKEANFIHTTFTESADFEGATFTERANFAGAKFSKEAYFEHATFSRGANFSQAKFLAEVYFLENIFTDITVFRYAIFEKPIKVTFDDSDLPKVSFADSDVTRIRFGDGIRWGGEDGFTIIEEEWLKNKAEGKKGNYPQDITLELVLSVYRNLRENYEFRLRYDDAGRFFIKEMELKRNYRHVSSKYEFTLHRKLRLKWDTSPLPEVGQLIGNNGLRKHFSLTGLYYHLSRYGESISRPAMIGVITVFLSTLFWVTQSNPTLEPHFSPTPETNSTSTFVGFEKAGNATQWLEGLERSLAGFLPFLSVGGETQVGIIDYIIKIFGGGLTFVLLAIALRRKFERKYTR
jgi:hypothetical protein